MRVLIWIFRQVLEVCIQVFISAEPGTLTHGAIPAEPTVAFHIDILLNLSGPFCEKTKAHRKDLGTICTQVPHLQNQPTGDGVF